MINRAVLKVLALFPMLLLLSAGSCNRTDIRNAGTIESGSNVFKTGGKYVFTLRVPDELEGKVYKAMLKTVFWERMRACLKMTGKLFFYLLKRALLQLRCP